MKKILVIFFIINLFVINNSHSEILKRFCLVSKSDLEKAKLDESEFSRFAGKVIKFEINLDEKLIYDVSEDSQLSVITGINQEVINFRTTANGLNYTNEQDVRGDNGKMIKYSYNNTILTSLNPMEGKLISRVEQSGLSMKRFMFSIRCRSSDYNSKEKEVAKLGPSLPFKLSDDTNKKKKKVESIAEKDTTNYDIVDLQSYTITDIDSLLYLHKIKLFENINYKKVFLKHRKYLKFEPGQQLSFEDIKDLNEKHFFNLPLLDKFDIYRLKKLKKEYFNKKKTIKKSG